MAPATAYRPPGRNSQEDPRLGTAHDVDHDVDGVVPQRADQVRPPLQRHVRAFGQDLVGLRRGADSDHCGAAAFRELDRGETDSTGCSCHQNALCPDAGAMQHVFCRRIGTGDGGKLGIAPVRVHGVSFSVRCDGELGEPAVAFTAQSPTLEGAVPHVAAQHVPYEDPLPDPFSGNALTDGGDASAHVGALDSGKSMASPDQAASAAVIVAKPSVPPAFVSEATALEYQPIRVLMSVLLIAAAVTSIRTSPSPGRGTGTSLR